MTSDVRVGDIGASIELTVTDQDAETVDVSTASALTMVFVKPDGVTRLEKAASPATDGRDGKIRYLTEDGFLDQAGTWQYDAVVTIGATRLTTTTQKFKAGAVL